MSQRKYTLPWPPSVNDYWGHTRTGRTFIYKSGVEFRDRVIAIAAGSGEPMEGRLEVFVEVYPPNRRRRDLDNVLKAILDGLEHAGVYKNDGQIDRLHVDRCSVVEGGAVCVSVHRLEGGE